MEEILPQVAALVGLASLSAVLTQVMRGVAALRRDLASSSAAIRRDIDELHTAHEYARVEHLRILTDVERANALASNEVRMAAGTVRAITDELVSRDREQTSECVPSPAPRSST